ncbi:MAG: FAD-binding oxidoreductase [Thermoplasmata archaeon]
MNTTHGVVIVGGGIVGLALAHRLASAGRDVKLFEAGKLGEGSTAAAMGHVVTLDQSPGQFALTQLGVRLWSNLPPEVKAAVGFLATGTVWVATSDDAAGELSKKASRYRASGVEVELLDAEELRRLEPNLQADLMGGLLVKSDAVLDQRRAAQCFAEGAERAGARLLENQPVSAIDSHRVTLESGESVHAESIVVAAGVGSARVLPGMPVHPRKGHLLQFEVPARYVTHQIAELGYARAGTTELPLSVSFDVQPRGDTTLWVGASRQNGTEDPRVEPAVVELVRRRAAHFLPNLASLPLERTWAGFRPSTPDDLPLLGRVSGLDDVYVASGHEGFGITTCLATSLLMTRLIEGRTPEISMDPYRPDRFPRDPEHRSS